MTGYLPYIYDHFAVHIIRFFVRYYYAVWFFFNKEKGSCPAGAPTGRYLAPGFTAGYEYIFVWEDDMEYWLVNYGALK